MSITGASMNAVILTVVVTLLSTVAGDKNDDLAYDGKHKQLSPIFGRLERGLFDFWNSSSEAFEEPNEVETFESAEIPIESMESKPGTTPRPEVILPDTPCSKAEKLKLMCLRVQRRIFHDQELAQIRQNQEQEWGTMKRQHLQRIFDFELRAAKAKAEQAELELQMAENRYLSH